MSTSVLLVVVVVTSIVLFSAPPNANASNLQQCTDDLVSLGESTFLNSTDMHLATATGSYGWTHVLNNSWLAADTGTWRQCVRLPQARYCWIISDTSKRAAGSCVPRSCDESTLAQLNSSFISRTVGLPSGFNVGAMQFNCSEVEKTLPIGGIVVITLIALLMSITLLAGAFEVLLHLRPHVFDRSQSVHLGNDHEPLLGGSNSRITIEYTDDDDDSTRNSINTIGGGGHNKSLDQIATVSVSTQQDYMEGRLIHAQHPRIVTSAAINGASAFDDKQPKQSHHSHPWWLRVLFCWAPYRNYQRLVAIPPGHPSLRTLNALRVLSILMVMFGHSWYFWSKIGLRDIPSLREFVQSFKAQPIIGMTYSVDQFLFLSGFLVTYLFLKSCVRHAPTLKTWVMYYVHRVWRLTPVMALAIMVWWKVAQYAGHGPLYVFQQQQALRQCNSYWWTSMLYINNFYPLKFGESCFGWGWYMAVDMQYYVFTPILLLMYLFNKLAGISLTAILLLASITIDIILSIENDLSANSYLDGLGHHRFLQAPEDYGNYPNLIYYKPWARAGPYLIGVLVALLLNYRNDKIQFHDVLRYFFYVLCVCTFLFLGFITYDESNYGWDRTADVLNIAFSRNVWVLAVAFLFLASFSNRARPLTYILSADIWVPFARLTYAAYLYHPIIIVTYYSSREVLPLYVSTEVLLYFCGYVTFAFTVSFVNFLVVEKPLMNLEAMLLHTASS